MSLAKNSKLATISAKIEVVKIKFGHLKKSTAKEIYSNLDGWRILVWSLRDLQVPIYRVAMLLR